MANKYTSLKDLFTAIADVIRGKTGSTETIVADDFPDIISTIETGSDVSGVTATASDVLSGKVFVDSSGAEVTGTIATKTSSNLTASGATVTVPAGYYASQATKSVSTATQATPSISVSSAGLITASATQSAGYVSSGTKSATKQLNTKTATTYTPGTSNQTINSGYYLTGTQTISGDADLIASNIKSGVSIFNVAGTYSGAVVEEVTDSMITKTGSGSDAVLIINTSEVVSKVLALSLTFYRGSPYYAAMTLVSNGDGNVTCFESDLSGSSFTAYSLLTDDSSSSIRVSSISIYDDPSESGYPLNVSVIESSYFEGGFVVYEPA